MTEESQEYDADYKNLEFLLGGLFEYLLETTDFWDNHDSFEEAYDFILDWSKKLKSGLKEDYLPPKTPCTCPRDWAEDRMRQVREFIKLSKAFRNV